MQFVLKYPSALLLYFWELIIFKLTVGRSWNKGNKLENLFYVCLQHQNTSEETHYMGRCMKKKFLWLKSTSSFLEAGYWVVQREHQVQYNVEKKSCWEKISVKISDLVRSKLTSGNMLSCKNNIHMLFLQQVLLEHDRRSKDSTF